MVLCDVCVSLSRKSHVVALLATVNIAGVHKGIGGAFCFRVSSDVEEALCEYEAHLRELNHIELLSAYLVENRLYVFARQGSHGDLWMNTVDLVNRVSAAGMCSRTQGEFYFCNSWATLCGDDIEFIAGAHRSQHNGGPAIRTYLIPLQGDSNPVPTYRCRTA